MIQRTVILATFTLLAACSQQHELARCSGPAVALNPGKWTPTAEQQAQIDRLVQEACR